MKSPKLGHLQRSVLDLASKHEGLVWAALVLEEIYGYSADATPPVATRNTVSRVLWSLEKRGLLEKAPEVRGFRLSN